MIEIHTREPAVRLFTSGCDTIEGTAMEQLEKTAQLPGIIVAAGMPDLHPGKGCPVGAAFLSRQYIYPHLIGNDIGCGMGLWKTSIKKQKVKLDKWVKKLKGLEALPEGSLPGDRTITPFGTIGRGNHFAELLVPEHVMNPEEFLHMGLDKTALCILVHSGSRGIGEAILRRHTDMYRADGLPCDTPCAKAYMEQHDMALAWARENRSQVAQNFAGRLGGAAHPVLDHFHNSIRVANTRQGVFLLHRKGVSPSDNGVVVIPGSRGTLTYLVKPVGNHELNLFSLPHGAGRKWNRKSCKERLKGRFSKASLSRTCLGSRVICDNTDLLFEEAPQAFKNIEKIMDDLCQLNLIEIVATLRPLITYKSGRTS